MIYYESWLFKVITVNRSLFPPVSYVGTHISIIAITIIYFYYNCRALPPALRILKLVTEISTAQPTKSIYLHGYTYYHVHYSILILLYKRKSLTRDNFRERFLRS